MSESVTPEEFDRTLGEVLAFYDVELPPDRVDQLDRYRTALWRWNEQLNLTRHTTLDKFVDRDVADSLQLAALIRRGDRVLDVGSGGGVPGIVMAICRSDLRVTLCESTQKKARVLQTIVDELRLAVEVFGCRVEELLELRTYDVLVARGVAPLSKMLEWLQPYWDAFDQLLLVKGRIWPEERSEARRRGLLKSLNLRRAAVYGSPDSHRQSVILRLFPKGSDPTEQGGG